MIYTSFCLYMCYRALTTLRRFQYFYIFLSYLKEGGVGGESPTVSLASEHLGFGA